MLEHPGHLGQLPRPRRLLQDQREVARLAVMAAHDGHEVVQVRIGPGFGVTSLREALASRPSGVIEDRIGGSVVSIRFDREHRTAQAFDTAGRELPAYVAFWFAWSAFYPSAEVFVARQGPQ